jgi:hypothetical protein
MSVERDGAGDEELGMVAAFSSYLFSFSLSFVFSLSLSPLLYPLSRSSFRFIQNPKPKV